MKRATIADAPAVLNTNDKAMWVLGFNAAAESVDLTQWEKARYGVFHQDGRFEELPADTFDRHPLAHTARWVGGRHDMELLRAALSAATTGVVRAARPKHVCGEQGYNGMIDPPCPACEANRTHGVGVLDGQVK